MLADSYHRIQTKPKKTPKFQDSRIQDLIIQDVKIRDANIAIFKFQRVKIHDKKIKIHIKNQVNAGASIIQIFDSWAGLINTDLEKYIYKPTKSLVEYTKELGVPVICFTRGIKDYKNFCDIVKPSAVNIDYDIDPKYIVKNIDIPIQGGLDPKILLQDEDALEKETKKYLNIFKDHPYIFNLGHGILPETKMDLVKELIDIVRNYK